MDFLSLLGLILYQMAALLISPLFWLVVLVIVWQMYRMNKMKSDFFHVPRERIGRKTAISVLLGLAGGLIGSVLLVILGVSVQEIGIEYLWIVAIVLILFRQRFMCFAYSGGLIALSKYFFGWPEVNIAQLLALVAVLHLVESLLIFAGGYLKAMPIYTMGRDRKLIGGFVMQSFWPLPLVALSANLVPMQLASGELLAMPGWWPLLPMEYAGGRFIPGMMMLYTMLPVLAALGYSDLALTMDTRKKAAASSRQLLLYSIALLLLAILAGKYPATAIIAALFAPVGHELLILKGQKQEQEGQYLYTEQEQGVMILEVLHGYPAESAGLRTGDVLLMIDDLPINTIAALFAREEQAGNTMQMLYRRGTERMECQLKRQPEQSLGIITVPAANGLRYLDFNGGDGLARSLFVRLKRWWKKLKSKHTAASK